MLVASSWEPEAPLPPLAVCTNDDATLHALTAYLGTEAVDRGGWDGHVLKGSEALFITALPGDSYDQALSVGYLANHLTLSGVLVVGAVRPCLEGLDTGDLMLATRSLNRFGHPAPRDDGAEALSSELWTLARETRLPLHSGVMAGDLQESQTKDQAWLKQNRVAAVGAGGYGAARACHAFGLPFAECRVVSSLQEAPPWEVLGRLLESLATCPVN